MKFTSKQVTTIIVTVAAVFIVMAILTMVIGDDENESNSTSNYTESSVSKNSNSGPSSNSGSGNGSAQKPNAKMLDSTDYLAANKKIESDPYEELDELIGLTGVKKEVHDLANFVKIQKQREKQGLKVPKISYHLVFTGSPGTGKTTVARIVARIYKDLGILDKGHLVETDRSGLVAEYVGQTAVKTNHIIDSAMGGVLFIDEAYALVTESGNDYGNEAIATLLKRMEDNRDSLVVVIAGYTNEMKRFIDANPGLQSRFNRYIDFPDYTANELFQIFEMQAKKNQYQLNEDAAAYLRERLEYVVQHKDRNFGNGRYSRNLFEKSIQNQANRLKDAINPTTEMLCELTKEDIENALKTTK